MLKVNIQTFAIKINDRKYLCLLPGFTNKLVVEPMGEPLSVIFSDIYIYMTKIEHKVVNPSKFYKRFVDDIINRRNKSEPDDLLQKLNNNHPNMKYTVEIRPEIFLDKKIVYSNDVITTEVKRNDRKLPVH